MTAGGSDIMPIMPIMLFFCLWVILFVACGATAFDDGAAIAGQQDDRPVLLFAIRSESAGDAAFGAGKSQVVDGQSAVDLPVTILDIPVRGGGQCERSQNR